jgi:hypothetical protein
MLEVFFTAQGLVHYEFILEGRTVNKEMHAEIFRRLRNAVRRKCPGKWTRNSWFLVHDNAPAHRSLVVKQYLAKHNVTASEHPQNFPDSSPPEFSCFRD